MRWSPGRILGLGARSLASLGGEHAAPHAGETRAVPFASPEPPDFPIPTARLLFWGTPDPRASSPVLAHSAGGIRGGTAEPQPPPPRTCCRSAAPPDTSGGPALRLSPSPPDLLSPLSRLAERSPGSAFLLCCARCSGSAARARPRATRATGARHQVGPAPTARPCYRAGASFQAGELRDGGRQPLSAVYREPGGAAPGAPSSRATGSPALRAGGLRSLRAKFALRDPRAPNCSALLRVLRPGCPQRWPPQLLTLRRLASRRRGRILLRRRPLSLRRARWAGAASPPHTAGVNLPGPRRRAVREPRAPAAALRLCFAPGLRPRAARLQIPPAPPADSRSLSPLQSATCRLWVLGTSLCLGAR